MPGGDSNTLSDRFESGIFKNQIEPLPDLSL